MEDGDKERYFETLRNVLSPKVGEKSFNIVFTTDEVQHSEQHKRLMKLLQSKLEDEEARAELFQSIARSVEMEDNYLALMECESMDLPSRNEGGDSEEVLTYMLCAICPVKQAKEELHYEAHSKDFRNASNGSCVGKPEYGFLFPAYNDGYKDIYGALFYAKDINTGMALNLLDNLFGKDSVPDFKESQSENFASIMQETLGKDCTMELVDHMRNTVSELQANQDEDERKAGEQVTFNKESIKECLLSGGVTEEQAEQAAESFEETFGEDAKIPADAIVDPNKYQVLTDYCKIIIDPKESGKVSMKTINGVKYIMIQADHGTVSLNGIPLEQE